MTGCTARRPDWSKGGEDRPAGSGLLGNVGHSFLFGSGPSSYLLNCGLTPEVWTMRLFSLALALSCLSLTANARPDVSAGEQQPALNVPDFGGQWTLVSGDGYGGPLESGGSVEQSPGAVTFIAPTGKRTYTVGTPTSFGTTGSSGRQSSHIAQARWEGAAFIVTIQSESSSGAHWTDTFICSLSGPDELTVVDLAERKSTQHTVSTRVLTYRRNSR